MSIFSGFLFVFVKTESELAREKDEQKQQAKTGLARFISPTKLL
jgi:hypothetical protein